MNIFKNSMYQEDVVYVSELDLPWKQLEDKSVMISGADVYKRQDLQDVDKICDIILN